MRIAFLKLDSRALAERPALSWGGIVAFLYSDPLPAPAALAAGPPGGPVRPAAVSQA